MSEKIEAKVFKAELDEIKKSAMEVNNMLSSMSDKQREKFIFKVLNQINRSLDDVIENPTKIKRFGKDVQNSSHIIIGCLLYSIESKYRQKYIDIILKLLALEVMLRRRGL